MKLNIILIAVILGGFTSEAQYNPLWIKHCRDIPSKAEDYGRLADVLNGKNQGQAADSEMDLLVGICYMGSGNPDLAHQMFDKIMSSANSPGSRANVTNDAINFEKFLKNQNAVSKAEIVSEHLNLRRGPDKDAPLRGRAFHGETYSVLEQKGDWAYVINIKGQGWVLTVEDNSPNIKVIN
ncbi:MAG: SH3 domain-containing protein [Bacteroidetes bacterium]|nr:SH3 domain-containing protein [Bacteroidota bacterium]MDA1121054.1 SH3 domain-containing protein [Bacteroidota bacterium]